MEVVEKSKAYDSNESTSSGSESGVNLSPTLIPPRYSFSWLTTLYAVGKMLPSSKTGSKEMLYESMRPYNKLHI